MTSSIILSAVFSSESSSWSSRRSCGRSARRIAIARRQREGAPGGRRHTGAQAAATARRAAPQPHFGTTEQGQAWPTTS